MKTRVLEARYRQTQYDENEEEDHGGTSFDIKCRLCGAEDETIEHIVIKCQALGGVRTKPLMIVLGFGENVEWNEVNNTKRRFAIWATRDEGSDINN